MLEKNNMNIPNIDLYHLLKPPAIIEYESSFNQQSRRKLEDLIFAQNKGDTQSTDEYYKSLLRELEAALKQYKKLEVYQTKDKGLLLELAVNQEGTPIAAFEYEGVNVPIKLTKITYFRSGNPLTIYFNSNNWGDYKSIDRVVVEEGTSEKFIKLHKNLKSEIKEMEKSRVEFEEDLKSQRKEMEKSRVEFEEDLERIRKKLEGQGGITSEED